ncbi:hypothetical protein COTS27_01590 [Spirochaetota bacterium]|nr:hypothetical protein COTS27_01590 [Spirochaetota bacterium]
MVADNPSDLTHSAQKLSIGQTIHQARLQRRLSIKELSQATLVSEQFIHRTENNQFARLPTKVYAMSLFGDLLEHLDFDTTERERLLTALELELNSAEDEKYNLLKNESFTPRVSKFSMQKQNATTASAAAVESPPKQAPPMHKKQTLPQPPQQSHSLASPTLKNASSKNNYDEEHIVDTKAIPPRLGGRRKYSVFMIRLVWSGAIFLTLLIIGLFLWLFLFQSKGLAIEEVNEDAFEKRFQVFALYGSSQTFEMSESDQLRIFFSNNVFVLSLMDITANSVLFTDSDNRPHSLALHNRHFIDFNNDEQADLLLKYQKLSGELAIVFVENLTFSESLVDYEYIWNNQQHVLVEKNYTLLTNQIKIPITVYVKALTLPVHLSYNIDGRRQNTVNLSTGASIIITADEHLELQIGNYLASGLIINNIPINLFLEKYNRYSTTKIIKWLSNYDNETLFDLVITDYIN